MAKKFEYVDFHCHPALKTFLGGYEENERENCWEEIDVTGLLEWVDLILGNILDSKSSLTQNLKGGIKLLVAGLYPTEIPIITGELVKVKKQKVNLLLASSLIPELNHQLLKAISEKQMGYHEVFNDLKTHLLNSETLEKGFNLVHNASDIKENKLNIILAAEGAHSLFHDVDNFTDQEVLDNLNSIKTGTERFLYLTLTHITQNPVCNHAWGIKDIKDERFKPKACGISDLGKDVIKKALSTENGEKRIFIDVKHMSLRSRLEYYKMVEDDYDNKIPIIASHTGITGVSYSNMPVYKYKVKGDFVKVKYYIPEGLMSAHFNPWSINLYDEEIKIIIDSGGLIGMNLDERILGTKDNRKKNRVEYFSAKEFEGYKSDVDANLNFFKSRHSFDEAVDDDPLVIVNKDLKHLCNNILHIVKIGGEKAWDHICIGSDFDGMINAVECCKTSEKFGKLEKRLERMLPKMAETDYATDYYVNNIEEKVSRIMSKNALKFITTYFI